jgi:uncharacterized lipoprotein YajG
MKAIALGILSAVVICILVLVLSGCAGPQSITKATLRDTIFSVEPRNNGVTVMWMTHDDVGAYCTTRPEIAEKMNQFLHQNTRQEVLVDYQSLNVGDEGYDLLSGGCATDANTTNYIVIDIRLPDGGE